MSVDKFSADASKSKVIKAFQSLGFVIVREREHISMVRENADGTRTPLTLPNHPKIKGPTASYDLQPVKNIPEGISFSL